jgi:hypothetical protein
METHRDLSLRTAERLAVAKNPAKYWENTRIGRDASTFARELVVRGLGGGKKGWVTGLIPATTRVTVHPMVRWPHRGLWVEPESLMKSQVAISCCSAE